MDPRAVKGFIPGIVKAAEFASKGAPHYSEKLNLYINYCIFEMFNTFMFGDLTCLADPGTTSNPENEQYCEAACKAFDHMFALNNSPFESIMHYLEIRSKLCKEYEKTFSTVREIGMKKIDNFIVHYKQNDLNELEKSSYLAHAIERQAAKGCNIIEGEMRELCLFSLFASVDTTSSAMSWLLVHMALNPDVQEKLYNELRCSISDCGQHLNAKALSRQKSPYLHACIRESHRLTLSLPSALTKSTGMEVYVHGVKLAKNSTVLLNHVGKDSYIDDLSKFKTERWVDDAVNARKGTEAEVIDHPLFRDNFSQGARRCPGSRVATSEILALISQLVLDWEISSSIKSLDEVTYHQSPFITPDIPNLQFVSRKA